MVPGGGGVISFINVTDITMVAAIMAAIMAITDDGASAGEMGRRIAATPAPFCAVRSVGAVAI